MKYKVISLNLSLLFIFGIAILGFTGALGVTKKCTEVNTTAKKLPIYSVDTKEKKIAITFDAAWSDEDTKTLVDILEKHNAKATFFCVGDYVRKYPNAVKIFYKNGHEIGNHSDTHKLYSQNTSDVVREELVNCNKEIENITGVFPTVCRPPSGDYDNKSLEIAESMGMYTIQWDVDSRDWKGLSVDEMYENITENAKNGSIILFHNGIKNTPEVLDKVLYYFGEKGYKFVTISEMIYKDNYYIDFAGNQKIKDNDATFSK